MAEQCTLYISNITKEAMATQSGPTPYQMDVWRFPYVDPFATVGVDVEFYKGSHDEDDGAEQYYGFGYNVASTALDVYATSTDQSVHWLSVRSMGGTAPGYCVVAIASNTTIPGATASTLQWYPISGVTTASPQAHTPPDYRIGSVSTNGMAMAFAVVDLIQILDVTNRATYFDAIVQNTLTSDQRDVLYVALRTAMAFANKESTWMTQSWDTIGSLALSSVCMPATHDSGMSQLSISTSGSDACNTQTQYETILQQLQSGARYFDFRPALWNNPYAKTNEFYLSHYVHGPGVGAFGSAGRPLASALSDVATFLGQTKGTHELIVLKFSHFGEIGLDSEHIWKYSDLTDTAYDNIVGMVANKLGPYLFKSSDSTINLNQLTMQTLSGASNTVLAVFDLGTQGSNDFPSSKVDTANGIFGYQDYMTNPPAGITPNIVVFDQYANSDNLDKMIADQKTKFENWQPQANRSFLLSWTLTMGISDQINGSPCISQLANEADQALAANLDTWIADKTITATKKPNFLLLDYLASYQDRSVELAMQINALQ